MIKFDILKSKESNKEPLETNDVSIKYAVEIDKQVLYRIGCRIKSLTNQRKHGMGSQG